MDQFGNIIKKEIEEGINKYYIQIIILNNLNSDIEEKITTII